MQTDAFALFGIFAGCVFFTTPPGQPVLLLMPPNWAPRPRDRRDGPLKRRFWPVFIAMPAGS